MPFVTHFTDTDGEKLPIAGTTYYTVRIPAAESENLLGWYHGGLLNQDGWLLSIGALTWLTKDTPLELKSENAALATEHNLMVYQIDGAMVLTLDSLPEQESVLYIYVPNAVNGGELHGATPVG